MYEARILPDHGGQREFMAAFINVERMALDVWRMVKPRPILPPKLEARRAELINYVKEAEKFWPGQYMPEMAELCPKPPMWKEQRKHLVRGRWA